MHFHGRHSSFQLLSDKEEWVWWSADVLVAQFIWDSFEIFIHPEKYQSPSSLPICDEVLYNAATTLEQMNEWMVVPCPKVQCVRLFRLEQKNQPEVFIRFCAMRPQPTWWCPTKPQERTNYKWWEFKQWWIALASGPMFHQPSRKPGKLLPPPCALNIMLVSLGTRPHERSGHNGD